MGVFGIEVGPGPEDVAFGVEGDGLFAGEWQYVHGGHGCHGDAVSVLCADGVGIGGGYFDVGLDELACEVAVAGADLEEGMSCGHLGDPPDGGLVMMGNPKRELYSRRSAVRSISVRVGWAWLLAHPVRVRRSWWSVCRREFLVSGLAWSKAVR